MSRRGAGLLRCSVSSNDFGYNPDVARNVSVDIRYLLWILGEVERARKLLRELGVRK